MGKVRTLSLVLTVFAISVVAVSSASALPEFKSGTGFPVTFTSESILPLKPVLHAKVLGENNVVCAMATDKGELTSATMVGKVEVHYVGCEEEGSNGEGNGKTCTTTGHEAGLIVTKLLKGRIGYVSPKVGKTVGVELEPESGSFAEFTCTGAANKVTVAGCTIGEANPLNTGSTEGTLTFVESGEKQLYTEIEGGTHKPCELEVTASILKLKGKGWLMDNEKETFATPVELKA